MEIWYNRSNGWYSITSAYAIENAFSKKVNAKIGLMYMYDYLYANNWNGTQNYGISANPVRYGNNGWIHRSHTDNNIPSSYEWLLSRHDLGNDNYYGVWYVETDGSVSVGKLSNARSTRPVFYITPDTIISGNGTSTVPYIID